MPGILKRGERWYVRFKDAAGRSRRIRTTATTAAEARALAFELERKAERQRLGLDPATPDAQITLAQLCSWWLSRYCPPKSQETERYRFGKYVICPPAAWKPRLGDLPLAVLSTSDLDQLLKAMETAGRAPATVNKLRGMLHSVFETARRKKKWVGPNPVADTDSRHVVKQIRPTLSAEEADLVIEQVPASWRGVFATAFYTALRKGELLGLRKRDVDLERLELTVGHSYGQEGTKGGKVDVLPIAGALVPFLEQALKASPADCEWLFPGSRKLKGKLVFRARTKEADPHKILKSALRRAGIITGYTQTCRRPSCPAGPISSTTDQVQQCVVCGMKLWVSPVERPLRFHDIRHTTITLLLRAGVDWHRVQLVARHSDLKVTIGTYSHLSVGDLRPAINVLSIRKAVTK